METTIVGGEEWEPIHFYYYAGKKDQHYICQLCGHNPIKRVFVIKSRTSGQELHIGSECATNYLDADIISGLTKMFGIEYNKIVNPIKYEDGVQVLEWAVENTIQLPLRMRSEFINSGSASSVLQKINNGKGISKREKEVMESYKIIFNNHEGYKVVTKITEDMKEMMYEKRQKQIEEDRRWHIFQNLLFSLKNDIPDWEKMKERNEEIIELLAQVDKESLGYFQKNTIRIVEDRIKNGLDVNNYISSMKEIIESKNKQTVIDDIFNKLDEKDLSDNQKSFVESVRSQYNNKKSISDKQRFALERFLSNDKDESVKQLFDKIEEFELGSRDKNFVASINKFYNDRDYITPKQKAALENIIKKEAA